MTLTQLIRKLETQLKSAEKLTRKYDAQADALRGKLAHVATAIGKTIAEQMVPKKKAKKLQTAGKKSGRISPGGLARISAAQRKRWAKVRARNRKRGGISRKKTRKIDS